jgi:phosphoglycolate phosphatase-like HAD superfamily hydrolase
MAITKEQARAHVIFDNDGTMVNSESNFLSVIVDILPKYLDRAVTLDEVKKTFIPDWQQFLTNLGLENPSTDIIREIITDVINANKDYIPELYPGILELIHKLHQNNIATYVWTARDERSAMDIFNHYEMVELFTQMQFMDTCISKPDPNGLELMLGDIPKEKIVHIGDSVVDINGASSFNVPCLIVDWDKRYNAQEFMDQGAKEVFSDVDKLYDWIVTELL